MTDTPSVLLRRGKGGGGRDRPLPAAVIRRRFPTRGLLDPVADGKRLGEQLAASLRQKVKRLQAGN